ncbi:MAG: DEAD/DEAH box helicase [candidate division KSB1 bacterium]|jgi:ATP-dependent Lhr-like helicase|nr:DEAD/DEAH box helicase [candidate division KSB1 bacterium]
MTARKNHIIDEFHPIIRSWFRSSFDSPTPPQLSGWPPIFRGEHTLILSPTGSGKTLAAFLVCIHRLIEGLLAGEIDGGVHTLYISPLKALNYDIERNLEQPLADLQRQADVSGEHLPQIRVAVRTGDTTQKEREQMIKDPPHILITTPESLHLLLTSTRPQKMLTSVKYVILDEIHALSDNKRGTFTSILLERLQYLADSHFQRIGLSATQNPLEEIARFMGGYQISGDEGKTSYTARPVTIVDAGMRKNMDLKIVSPVDDFKSLPENTIWPDIYNKLLELIQAHRSTLIFTNNRAAAERITSEINDRAGYELARAHHGSISKSVRKEIEGQLKKGEIPALVATATLELGIDMGAIDLVCQVESTKSVARGLQRVGRAGHLFKSTSMGRFLPKTRADLLDMAVLTRAMKQGDVAPIRIPRNCLDILAQQIIAMVAIRPWKTAEVYNLVRCAWPYQELPYESLISVLEMISGQYPSDTFKDLKPRVSWDRVNQILYPLPGTQRSAIFGGGAIPDTGQFGCYLQDNVTRIGELEEEFVYERRLGEVFTLGTNSWRIVEITHDRVIVAPAPGEVSRMPFWKGEFYYRDPHFGEAAGAFCREVKKRLDNRSNCLKWMKRNSDLDDAAALNLYHYFKDMQEETGIIPDDETVLIESFRDDLGDMRVAILTPYGGRFHLPWLLAILNRFRDRWGIAPESHHSDAGILFRFTSEDLDEIMKVILSVTSENLQEAVIEELGNSFFFGLRFRQNANRAMLIPRPKPGKRAPLWLQRMRARDLLEISREYRSFPIVTETYRESLQDYLAMDVLKRFLARLESGEIRLHVRRASQPSPFVSSLMFEFMAAYMYDYDEPKMQASGADALDVEQLQQLLYPGAAGKLLRQDAVAEVDGRLQSRAEGYRARTAAELVELLRRSGDLTRNEIEERIEADTGDLIKELNGTMRIVGIVLPNAEEPERWIVPGDYAVYRDAFSSGDLFSDRVILNTTGIPEPVPAAAHLPEEYISERHDRLAALERVISRFIVYRALVTEEEIAHRYPVDNPDLREVLNTLHENQEIVELSMEDTTYWAHPENVQYIRKVTLRQQRREAQPCDTAQYVDFLLRWQHRAGTTGLEGMNGIMQLFEMFQGAPLPAEVWENEILTRRLKDFSPQMIDELSRSGEIVWYGTPGGSGEFGNIVFTYRESLDHFHPLHREKMEEAKESTDAGIIRAALEQRGASFLGDIASESGLAPSACLPVLWQMIWRGEVSNDSYSAVRSGRPLALADETRSALPRGRQRYKVRLNRAYSHYTTGRWSLIPSADAKAADSAEIIAMQIMARYGLICRELYDLEGWPDPWYRVYTVLTRLEWRGEIRRGYFVKGFSGLQFALPQAAHRLMQLSQEKNSDASEMVLINACDPANLYGAASPLPLLHPLRRDWRFLRHPNNWLIIRNGLPLIAVEANGSRLTPLRDLTASETEDSLALLPRLLEDPPGWRRIRSVKVETWNGEPVRNTTVAPVLKKIGFRDEFKEMVLERAF